jgi:hypothetical protein
MGGDYDWDNDECDCGLAECDICWPPYADYPDNDQYCPECHEVLGYVLRDGAYVQMCNHCGWPRNKAKEEARTE